MSNKNKKGAFLLDEEGVKIILAVICIVGLIAFVVYVYFSYTQNKDLNNAKASLAHLVSDLNSGSTQDIIYNPKGWILASFPEKVGGTYPVGGPKYSVVNLRQCTNNRWTHCLCLCPPPSSEYVGTNADTNQNYLTSSDGIVNSCNSQATCLESDFSINYFDQGSLNKFEYNGYLISHVPFTFTISQKTKTISIGA